VGNSVAGTLVFTIALLHMRAGQVSRAQAALGYGIALGALALITGGALPESVVRCALGAAALWLLGWVNETFHSWATLPLWFIATVILFWFV
jgi:hypothetical protein